MNMEMTNKERYERGLDTLNTMAGEKGMQPVLQLDQMFPAFGKMLISLGFGDLYSRGTLDLKQRELITMTSLITQGSMDQLGFHVHAALNVGLKPEEIVEMVMHCAGYAGFPKACGAMNVLQSVFQQRGISLPLESEA